MTTQEFFKELPGCNLCKERTLVQSCPRAEGEPVPAKGNFNARAILIGRNPGSMEARVLVPFCGAAGDKLNTALFIARIKRAECYVTNIVKCFTPSGVSPSIACRRRCVGRWLDRELALLEGLKLIVTFGNEALQYFDAEATVGQLHGTSFSVYAAKRAQPTMLFVMFHPAACLHDPRIIKRFEEDANELGKVAKELGVAQ